MRAYWENILNKINAIVEVPEDRWDWRQYYSADRHEKDKVYSKWGAFIDDLPFDPLNHGIPPNSLNSIEPLQLLSLEVVKSALEDAGYKHREFPRDRTSVIFGISGSGEHGQKYCFRSSLPMFFGSAAGDIASFHKENLPQWTEDSFPGILTNVTAGRIANRFDLGGVNCTIDAACASSLSALYLSVRELEAGTSDIVIAGGADCTQNPFAYLCFSRTQALSPRGISAPFDDNADGIVLGEGLAAIILKRLSDAERDGDKIYAVIKGVGASSDGRGKSLTAPRREGQIQALKRAYEQAGISPKTVGLIDAHATGTAVGDRVEIESMSEVFLGEGAAAQTCAIGSVKSMIGHTKSTAGLAGLIKVALSLHHKTLPATLNVTMPNKGLTIPGSPFYVNTETKPWLNHTADYPRRAGVSAFGFGGTNYHIVLEEYTRDNSQKSKQKAFSQWPCELFIWKNASSQRLLEVLVPLEGALAQGATPSLKDLAYTVNKAGEASGSGNDGQSINLAVVACSVNDLKDKLNTVIKALQDSRLEIVDTKGIYMSETSALGDGKLAFLFPGQGSQYLNMFWDLVVQFPDMQAWFERAERVVANKLDRPLSSYVFPTKALSKEERGVCEKDLARPQIVQPALGTANVAMYHLLKSLGITPDMAAGHSYGEYVALGAAGVFSADDLIGVAEARGRFITETAGADLGTMAAAGEDKTVVEDIIKDIDGVWIANINSPKQTVISGRSTAVDEAMERLKSKGVATRRFPIGSAFHSPVVAPANELLKDYLSRVKMNRPAIAVYSNTTAQRYPEDTDAIRALLVNHLVSKVDFVNEIETMYNDGARIFIEVGPGRVLSGLVSKILKDRPHLALISNQAGKSGLSQLLHLLGRLIVSGINVNMEKVYEGRALKMIDLDALYRQKDQFGMTPTTWLVNGARSISFKEAMAISPKKVVKPMDLKPESAAIRQDGAVNDASGFAAPDFKPADVLPSNSKAYVMIQHQKLMQRLLDMHQSVMMRYMNGLTPGSKVPISDSAITVGGHALNANDVITPAPDRVRSGTSRVAEDASGGSLIEPVSGGPAGAPGETETKAVLLQIVSERTGYPEDMLDLDLNLEADLGIDSIKRVEILNSLTQVLFPEGHDESFEEIEEITQSKTLREIITHIENFISAAGNPALNKPVSGGPAGAPGETETKAVLLQIVSERTGYPEDMLDLDLNLEADLGIDSIKRVEILNSLTQALFPEGHDESFEEIEEITQSKTLREIITHIENVLNATGSIGSGDAVKQPQEITRGSAPEDTENRSLPRFTLTAVEAPIEESAIDLSRDRVIIITDDERGVARSLQDKLTAKGYKAVTLRWGKEQGHTKEPVYFLNNNFAEEIETVVKTVQKQHGNVGGLIHLFPLKECPSFPGIDLSGWTARIDYEIKSLFSLLKCLAPDLSDAADNGGACVMSAVRMGGTFASGLSTNNTEFFPGHGGISGLLKTAAIELPGVRVKSVDLDNKASVSEIAENLFKEIGVADNFIEIGYSGKKRMRLGLLGSSLESRRENGLQIDSSWVILVTGGARGITAQIVLELARKYQPKLILAGRSLPPPVEEPAQTAGVEQPEALKKTIIDNMRQQGKDFSLVDVEKAYRRLRKEREMRSNISAMRSAGAEVEYCQVDVRHEKEFGDLIEGVYEKHGKIDAVIHGAGVIEDKLIKDKTLVSFDRVLGTKTESAFILSKKLRPESLKLLVLFSSVAGRFGNQGQCDYAAANEVINKLAVYLNKKWPGRVVSINWGPWDKSGMVSDGLREEFARRGVRLIPPAAGSHFMNIEIKKGEKGEVELVVGDGPWGAVEDTSQVQ